MILLVNSNTWFLNTKRYDARECAHLVGMIPSFFSDTLETACVESVMAEAEANYGFPCNDFLGQGHIDLTGVYHSKEDPSLEPIATLRLSRVMVHIYHYGLVGYRCLISGAQYLVRMD